MALRRKRKSARRKRKPARKYEVHAELENFRLARARSALKLQIYARGGKTGELQIGRGSVYWWGKHRQKWKRVGWGRFSDMMNKIAYGSEG